MFTHKICVLNGDIMQKFVQFLSPLPCSLTAQPNHPTGRTVKATVEASPLLFCSDCAAGPCEERGLVFSPHHTLAGPLDSFGLKSTTTVAMATYEKPLWKDDTSHSGKAVPSGIPKQVPRQCTACGSPKWIVYGFERSKCGECGNIF